VRAAAHAEIVIGRREGQVGEERAGHPEIVVLAGVDETLPDVRIRAQGGDQRRDLDEVGASPDDVHDGRHRRHSIALAHRSSWRAGRVD
jgi:hypothetical protein